MHIAKFNKSAFGSKRASAKVETPTGALPLFNHDAGTDPDFDDFGGHGGGKQDTEIAPGIHAEFGCYTASAHRVGRYGVE